MSELEKLKVITRYELLKQFRRKRFYGALVVTILAVFLTIGLYKGLDLPEHMRQSVIGEMPENTPVEVQENLLAEMGLRDSPELFTLFAINMGALVALAAVFFAGDAIAGEFERGTGYILFPNPVKRTTLVVGKYLACFIATAAILLVAYLITAASVFGFYGGIPGGILGSLAVTLAFVCFMISLAFAFSSVLKGGTGATIAALLTFMVVFFIISSSLSIAGYDPWFMPDRAQETMSATYGISIENMAVAFGGGGFTAGLMRVSQDPALGFSVLSVYAVVLFAVSVYMAKRREMI